MTFGFKHLPALEAVDRSPFLKRTPMNIVRQESHMPWYKVLSPINLYALWSRHEELSKPQTGVIVVLALLAVAARCCGLHPARQKTELYHYSVDSN